MNEYSAVLLFGLLDEAHNGVDYTLINDVLYAIFGPIEGEEAHAFYGSIVVTVSSSAVDDMCDLIESEPFDILNSVGKTWAMT